MLLAQEIAATIALDVAFYQRIIDSPAGAQTIEQTLEEVEEHLYFPGAGPDGLSLSKIGLNLLGSQS
jgi:hypothetical protein